MVEKPTYSELENQVKELSGAEDKLKLVLDKLRQSEERFRNLFEGSIQGQDTAPLGR